MATAGTRRPKADQRFRVGSVTKTFTATIVLQLVDEGKLGLSSTLEDHLPGVVPRGKEITIRQLLQHRSGLVNYTDYTSWLKGREPFAVDPADRPPALRGLQAARLRARHPVELLEHELHRARPRHRAGHRALVCRRARAAHLPNRSGSTRRSSRRRGSCPISATTTPLSLVPDNPKGDPTTTWTGPTERLVGGRRDRLERARPLPLLFRAPLGPDPVRRLPRDDEEDGRCRPEPGYGLGIASIGVRCGRAWGHGGGILDYGTLAYASEKGDRVGVISVYGEPFRHTTRRERTRLPGVSARSVGGRLEDRLSPRRTAPLRHERRRQRAAETRTRERPRLVAGRPEDRVSSGVAASTS